MVLFFISLVVVSNLSHQNTASSLCATYWMRKALGIYFLKKQWKFCCCNSSVQTQRSNPEQSVTNSLPQLNIMTNPTCIPVPPNTQHCPSISKQTKNFKTIIINIYNIASKLWIRNMPMQLNGWQRWLEIWACKNNVHANVKVAPVTSMVYQIWHERNSRLHGKSAKNVLCAGGVLPVEERIECAVKQV